MEGVIIELSESLDDKIPLNYKKGDLVLFYYNTVGLKSKTKEIIGVIKGVTGGEKQHRSIDIVFKKGPLNVLIKIPLYYPFLYNLKILKVR